MNDQAHTEQPQPEAPKRRQRKLVDAPPDGRWITLRKHLADRGDTADAVHARRRKKQWIDGVHCTVGPDGNLWIDPAAVDRWIEKLPQEDSESRAR